MNFRVALDTFRGPMDLLLYLVRKHEIDVAEIPIALIAEQFLEHLELLRELDVNAVGDFLDMASTLMEIKSRMILPRVDEDTETLEDPRDELVQRLLDYKKYRDAASILEDQSRQWQMRYPRMASDLPPREKDLAGQPIREVELWDLVSAFGRIIREAESSKLASIVYDDTPLHVYMRQIHQRLTEDGRVVMSEMFRPGMHKSALIGVFLAVLELVRHHGVTTEQNLMHGEIWILPGEHFREQFELDDGPLEELVSVASPSESDSASTSEAGPEIGSRPSPTNSDEFQASAGPGDSTSESGPRPDSHVNGDDTSGERVKPRRRKRR